MKVYCYWTSFRILYVALRKTEQCYNILNYWELCTNLQGFLHTMKRRRTTIQKALIAHPMMMPSFTLNSGLSLNCVFSGSSSDVGSSSEVLTFVAEKKYFQLQYFWISSFCIFIMCHHYFFDYHDNQLNTQSWDFACLEPRPPSQCAVRI